MSKKILALVVIATAVLSTAIGGGTVCAESTPIDWKVAGTIANVQLTPPFVAPAPGFLIRAVVDGAPGTAEFTVVSGPGDPVLPPSDKCGSNFGQMFLQNDMVITFPDRSMIFAKLDPAPAGGGWICFTGVGTVTAEAHMVITGGTGKYEKAGGEFVGRFAGAQVGTSGALSAETGTIEGWIERIAQ